MTTDRLGNNVFRKIVMIFIAILMISPIFLCLDTGAIDAKVSASSPQTNWAYIETFDRQPSGTTLNFNDVQLHQSANSDLVVLGGRLWMMFRGNEQRPIMEFSPQVPVTAWNLSFEAYSPMDVGTFLVPSTIGLRAMLANQNGNDVIGVELRFGPSTIDGKGIYFFENGSWRKLTGDILPAFPHPGTEYDLNPDLYRIGFEMGADGILRTTIVHSLKGVVARVITDIPDGSQIRPQLRFYDNITIQPLTTPYGNYGENGGWFIDNLAVRPAGMAYPIVRPSSESVDGQDPVWIDIVDENGGPILNAHVKIDGYDTLLNIESGRYESLIHREVDWAASTNYSITVEGMAIEGILSITTTSYDPSFKVSNWWNGWGWASVVGLDDASGPDSVLTFYQGFNHPATAYVQSLVGHSTSVLGTHNEIAIHYPHDFANWMKKNWAESMTSSSDAQREFKNYYQYASIWDDPDYVGNGDSYISMANPGNSATYQMMYAQYLAGVRIEGRGSTLGNGVPGNASLLGSYWPQSSSWFTTPGAAWEPRSPIDLMDASRQWSLDYPTIDKNESMDRIRSWAEDGILMRIYGHPVYNLNSPSYADIASVLHWISAPKIDGTPENWKATDGEAASYIYSRHTTEIKRNESSVQAGTMSYDVIRKDPRAAGYWMVPVTLDFDIGQSSIIEVQVIENGEIFSSLPGHLPLPNLNGSRVMEQGYDVRDGHLYISHFFNDSARVKIVLNDPHIINEPSHVGLVNERYVYLAQTTEATNLGSNWTLDKGTADWLSISSSNDTQCLLEGTPTMPGSYEIELRLTAGANQSSINWTIVVGTTPDIERPVTRMTSPSETIGWINTSVTIVLLATDNWSGVQRTYASIDSGPYLTYSTPIMVLKQGMHSISYFSKDWWGNVENVTTVLFGIDRLPPQLTISTRPDTLLPKDRPDIVFSATDDISGIQDVRITVDDAPPKHVTDQNYFSLTGYSTGGHHINITAVDKAGNIISVEIDVRLSALPSRSMQQDPIHFFIATGLVVFLIIGLIGRMTRKR